MANFETLSSDCEQLVRKMLVLDPTRRYTVEQIKRHRWMQAEEPPRLSFDSPAVRAEKTSDPNEQVLRVMQELGIDIARTREVSSSNYIISVCEFIY